MWKAWLFVVIVTTLSLIRGEVEICTDGGQHVFQITQEMCPFGVLFSEPQTADCLVFTGEDESGILADVCNKEPYSPDRKQFQFIPEISPDIIEVSNSCKSIMSPACNSPTLSIHPDSFLRQLTKAHFTFEPEKNDSNLAAVGAQTQRLFEYQLGLGKVEIDESHKIVLLLKKTFQIVRKFCSARFVPTAFIEDVESSFLFLFNEADTTNFQDLNYEQYERIMEHLTYCSDQRNPFKFNGKTCPTYSMIQSVNKSGQLFSEFDKSNADAFMEYDVPVEAAWGAIDFVHGLCYGTFRDHINSHHLYQQALERLFTKEILFRWKNRFVFQERQNIWNNFFSANVKLALTNLDMCIQSSYLSTPFLHRLERPIAENKFESATAAGGAGSAPAAGGGSPPAAGGGGSPPAAGAPSDPAGRRRKKRWTEAHALKTLDTVEGYCFITKEEADAALGSACK